MKREPVAWKGYAPSGKGYTQQEIAEMFGVAQQRISQIIEEHKNGHLSILVSKQTHRPTSTQSKVPEVDTPETPSDDVGNVLDATPYLKGGALYETF